MEDINKIQIGSDIFNLVDANGRALINSLNDRTTTLESNVDALMLNSVNKNVIYRGKDLGIITVDNIENFFKMHEISSGKFTDLFVGDTFTIKDGTHNVKWVIAGFNTEYNKGDTALTKNHIAVFPLYNLGTSYMNETNTTAGGYKGSYMHTTKLPEIANNLRKALGTHMLSHRCLLTTSVSDDAFANGGSGWKGASNNWDWADCELVLMTEVQVYGSTVFSSSGYDTGEGAMKLPIFNFVNHVKFARYWFWLRSVASSTCFCFANYHGNAYYGNASLVSYVRPLMLLG